MRRRNRRRTPKPTPEPPKMLWKELEGIVNMMDYRAAILKAIAEGGAGGYINSWGGGHATPYPSYIPTISPTRSPTPKGLPVHCTHPSAPEMTVQNRIRFRYGTCATVVEE